MIVGRRPPAKDVGRAALETNDSSALHDERGRRENQYLEDARYAAIAPRRGF
jgi:hypothetical protein